MDRQDVNYELHHGDCIEVMRTLPAGSVDAIVTSPPYAEQRKSTYGGIPEKDYPDWTVRWMSEAWRLLKPDGSVIINIRPHIKNGQISDYTLRTRLSLREDGWNEVDELIWFKRSAPPTGSPRKPRRSWESLHWFAKVGQPWSDAKAHNIMGSPDLLQDIEEAKAGKPRRVDLATRKGWGHTYEGSRNMSPIVRCRDVAEINLGRKGKFEETIGAHPATYPWQLAEWCGKLICPPGGTILDPFSGSASTGVAAIRNGWHYIGIDAVEDYIQMSRQRLEREQATQSGGFSDSGVNSG